MPCTVERRAAHARLRSNLAVNPAVLATDTLDPSESPARCWETEVVLEPECSVVPTSVLRALVDAECSVRDVSMQGRPGHVIVLAR